MFAFNSNAQLVANFTADKIKGCGSLIVNFSSISIGDSINYYKWDFGNGILSYEKNPITLYDTAGLYSVMLIVKDTANNIDTITKTDYIEILPLPVPDFNIIDNESLYSYFISFQETSVFTDTLPNNRKYYWDFDDGNKDSGQYVSHKYQNFGDYVIMLTIQDGYGCIDSLKKEYKLFDKFEPANVFTPNGDLINDVFYIKTNGTDTYEFNVYNRFGALIFTSTSQFIRWEGFTTSGVKVPEGTYYYTVKATNTSYNFEKKGYIQLFR